MIEHDFALQAILNGPVYMISYLTEHGVDWKAAVGSYATTVTTNVCAERALVRAVVKHMLHGDAMVGCEYDGDSTHVRHIGCRLDTLARHGSPSPQTRAAAADLSSSAQKEEVA